MLITRAASDIASAIPKPTDSDPWAFSLQRSYQKLRLL
jgi:hypothetical protein